METGKLIKIKIRYMRLTVALIVFPLFFFACSTKNQFASDQIINPSYSEEIEKIEAYLDEKNFDGALLISKNKDIILVPKIIGSFPIP